MRVTHNALTTPAWTPKPKREYGTLAPADLPRRDEVDGHPPLDLRSRIARALCDGEVKTSFFLAKGYSAQRLSAWASQYRTAGPQSFQSVGRPGDLDEIAIDQGREEVAARFQIPSSSSSIASGMTKDEVRSLIRRLRIETFERRTGPLCNM